jgi:tRNA uridine 5-carbamoylmethylation protein Kti12
MVNLNKRNKMLTNDIDTLVVNLMGAPGAGKSTGSAYVFSALKLQGINCELVQEYAKDRVWQKDFEVFKNQFYVTGKQSLRVSRLKGNVDVVITDSPIIQGAFYARDKSYYKSYEEVLLAIHNEYHNLNYYIIRDKPYNPEGRFQTELESDIVAKELRQMVDNLGIGMKEIKGNVEGYNRIVNDILEIAFGDNAS